MILAGRYWNWRFLPLILWCVLSIWRKQFCFHDVFWGRRELSTVKYISDFLKFQTVWCKTICFELPRGGGRTDARTHARTHGAIISFELSPLVRCMRINSNKGCPGVTENDWDWNQSQEEIGERGMWGRADRVRWESEKCVVLVGRYQYLTILPMISAGRYWNSRFQPLILWCVLSIWRKKYQFYGVFWGRRELSTVKYIGDFLKFQTVWCKSIGLSLIHIWRCRRRG